MTQKLIRYHPAFINETIHILHIQKELVLIAVEHPAARKTVRLLDTPKYEFFYSPIAGDPLKSSL
jgi:hypothetical protein